MSELRMPKGWTLVGTSDMSYGDTETRAEKIKREHRFRNLIRNTLTEKDEAKLQKKADAAYEEKVAYESQLKAAYAAKKLHSPRLVKEVKYMRKNKETAAEATA